MEKKPSAVDLSGHYEDMSTTLLRLKVTDLWAAYNDGNVGSREPLKAAEAELRLREGEGRAERG